MDIANDSDGLRRHCLPASWAIEEKVDPSVCENDDDDDVVLTAVGLVGSQLGWPSWQREFRRLRLLAPPPPLPPRTQVVIIVIHYTYSFCLSSQESQEWRSEALVGKIALFHCRRK